MAGKDIQDGKIGKKITNVRCFDGVRYAKSLNLDELCKSKGKLLHAKNEGRIEYARYAAKVITGQ